MDLNEYQNETAKTAIYPGQGARLGLIYCALKLNGETAEMYSAETEEDFVSEAGDVMWYIARAATELGVTLTELNERLTPSYDPEYEEPGPALIRFCGRFSEHLGKSIRDDGDILTEERCQQLINDLAHVLAVMLTGADTDIAEILSANLAKLRDRQARGVLQGSGDHR